MRKASTASGKTRTPLPSQSAWAKGPPQDNGSSSAPSLCPRSPAPSHAPSPITASHSRHPSTLGQGVPIKEGVSVPRSNVGSVRQGSPVTFGSIDDIAAPLSSSPAATPVVKTESVKCFGCIPATTSNYVNGKAFAPASTTGSSKLLVRPASSTTSMFSYVTSASTTPATTTATTSTTVKPALGKADIAKLFKGSSSSSQPSSDTSSPSIRPSNLPPHHQPSSSGQHPPQPPPQSQLGAHQYTPFVPGMQQQQGSNGQPSPAFSRPVPNGAGAPPRPMGGPGGPGGPPIPASPRLAPHHSHQHSHQPPAGVPPQQVPMQPMHWSPYYYPADAHGQPASPWFYSAHAKHQQPHPPHTPHHPPHAPQPPPQYAHQPSGNISVSSPLPTPSTATGPGIRPLNSNASIFVPTTRTPKAIVIKNENSTEVNLESLKIHSPQPLMVPIPPPPRVATSRRIVSVRIESEDVKRKRMERARLEQENEEAAEQAKRREQERKRKEEETKRKEKEEVERKEEVDQEWLRFEEDEWKRREGARLEEERKKAQEEKECAGREAEVAQLKADETQDILESPAENRAAPLSALATAKNIVRLQDVEYPEGIRGPREDLNKDAKDGKFRYDRGFLMQFMHVCKEKPLNLSRLDILGIEPVDPTSFNMIRGGSGRHRKTSISGPLEGKAGASP
ncbi:hypothetical protein PAXINDRAFT_103872, partial [Paxillus involutus ATCC 200175]